MTIRLVRLDGFDGLATIPAGAEFVVTVVL
jgi:hypothetical protein